MTMISDSGETRKAMVLAPNIHNFSSVNSCPVTPGVARLEKVNIKIRGIERIAPESKLLKHIR